MHKKTLIILLVIPFIIGLLSFVSVVIMNNTVAADITNILWDYEDTEGFQVSDTPYKLEAEAVKQENIVIAKGNNLVWSIRENPNDTNEYARIEVINDAYYLLALNEGECQVVCSNEKGTVSKSFTARIFNDAALIVNTEIKRSGQNVDKTLYWGQYDLAYSDLELDKATKKQALIKLNPTLFGGDSEIFVESTSNNIRHNEEFTFEVLSSGPAQIIFDTHITEPLIFNFEIVENGVNVYNYNDLLMCTNFSSKGEVIVMQTNLESLANTFKKDNNNKYIDSYLTNSNNTKLFGNFNFSTQTTSFNEEILEVESTFNTEYIDQYNKQKGTSFTKNIKVGIEVKKDIYGNGYTINGNELAFPNNGLKANNYDNHGILAPTTGDYFFGPLPFVTIGDLSNQAIVKAYGQDNALIYVSGDNVTINDLKVRNSNDIDNLYNLLFTGSVIDIQGLGVTLKNSIISHGRNVIRAYSSDQLHIDNCILRYGGQFLLALGANEYNKVDLNKEVKFDLGSGYSVNTTTKDFFTKEDANHYNPIMDSYFEGGKVTDNKVINLYKDFFKETQNALDNAKALSIESAHKVKVTRTYFATSGIFPIAFESLFNGPYLYNGSPSYMDYFFKALDVVLPNNISGTSAPVLLELDSKTRFYDWKDISDPNTINSSILLQENISDLVSTAFGSDVNLSIEDYFPMKRSLINKVNDLGYVYKSKDGKSYLNTKIAWYGGGLNLSEVRYIDTDDNQDMSDRFPIDIGSNSINGSNISIDNNLLLALSRYVTAATGYHEFNFITNGEVTSGITPLDFEKVPQIEDLYNNLK